LYQHYPGFENRMREALLLPLGEGVEKLVLMGLAKDGSEVGSALSLKNAFFVFVIADFSVCLFVVSACLAALGAWQATKS
jgi:hypothetical protein